MALALSAFIGVITVEMFRRAEITALRSQQAQFKDETKIILEAMASNLQNPESCTRMLFNQVLSPGMVAPVTLNYKYEVPTFRPTETTIADGTEVTNGIVAGRVEVFIPGVPDLNTRVAEIPTPVRRFRASLRTVWRSTLTPQLASVNWHSDMIGNDFGLPFYVWIDDANQIKSCFGINSAGTVCNMALGYYHVAPPGNPPLEHALSCRQTGFMTTDPTGAGARGACRFGGVRPTGTCPGNAFVVPGPQYAWPMQDGTQGYTPMEFCAQCE